MNKDRLIFEEPIKFIKNETYSNNFEFFFEDKNSFIKFFEDRKELVLLNYLRSDYAIISIQKNKIHLIQKRKNKINFQNDLKKFLLKETKINFEIKIDFDENNNLKTENEINEFLKNELINEILNSSFIKKINEEFQNPKIEFIEEN